MVWSLFEKWTTFFFQKHFHLRKYWKSIVEIIEKETIENCYFCMICCNCIFSCPDQYRCLKRASWTIGWCFLVFGFCARSVLGNQRLFLSIFSRLSSLDFSWQRYTLWFWNLSAHLVKNRWSVSKLGFFVFITCSLFGRSFFSCNWKD